MALVDNAWYVNFGDGATTGYYAVAVWSNHTAAAGELIRQLTAPAVGSERVFVCTTGGATGAVEPTWVNTRGALNTSSAAVYQECTGIAALNGDATNTPSWTITATPPGGVKNTVVTLGQVIKRDNGASYQICTVAGTAGNGAEPAFSNTAGTTTADNTVTWTSLGVVGNFTGWQAPHARGTNALTATWVQAGNKVFVGDNHAETQATALTWTGAGTQALPVSIYCADHTVAAPGTSNLKTTATVTVSGAVAITLSGIYYIYGIAFNGGSVSSNSSVAISGASVRLEACSIQTTTTAAANFLMVFSGAYLEMVNTTLKFGSTSQSLRVPNVGGIWLWKNTASATLGSIPTSFIAFQSGMVILQGVDLSGLTSSAVVAGATTAATVRLIDCKMPTGATIGTPTALGAFTDIIRTDTAATNYFQQRYAYQATLLQETTIVRTGGASDGTTPISWKLTTTANSLWLNPFESFPIAIWNDSTSAITTLTIYGTTTGGGVPNNDDIWVEVEYLGSTLTPLGSFITTTKANNLAASTTTNNSSDASTWGGGGAGNGFKIVVPSFTPGMKGPLNITVKVAKASSTYYIDPKVSI